jgi:rhamnose transport system ATP-binding protein
MDDLSLRLNSITKSFGAIRALRGVSFSLRPGEVHALLGENGAGKSTLIKIMTGAHEPDEGTIVLDGQAVGRLSPAAAKAHGIAAIYQQPSLFPHLSVAENIALGREKPNPFLRVRWSERRDFARDLLRRIGATIEPDTEVGRLSMPEQQLVEIACALGASARIMIMDEPTASLTQKEVDALFRVIRDLREHGVAIVYISHRLQEIFSVADRVTVLRDGESVGMFTKSELDEAALIRCMVGRDISATYPPSNGVVGDVVLSLRGLGCSATRVRDVSMDVRAGEILGLAGLVGAGRTELARVLFGITPADAGDVVLNGRIVAVRSPSQAINLGIAYVPEDRRHHGVILDMSIASNITMPLHSSYFPWSWLRLRAERKLAEQQMRDLMVRAPSADTLVNALSGGNQQKVALARWLAGRPKVLILDEPTQGVDVGAKVEIHKIIRGLAQCGLAVLMISSDLPEVLGMSDRITVMRGGTVAATLLRSAATADSIMAAALGQPSAA